MKKSKRNSLIVGIMAFCVGLVLGALVFSSAPQAQAGSWFFSNNTQMLFSDLVENVRVICEQISPPENNCR